MAVNPVGAVGGAAATVTVTETGALVPPGPVQLKIYVLFAVKIPVDCEPLGVFVPVQSYEAVHDVALLVEDQFKFVAVL